MFEYDTIETKKPKPEQVKMSFTREEIAWIDEAVRVNEVPTRQDFIRLCINHYRENG